MEVNEVSLPELLSVDGRPTDLACLYLSLPLVEGAEFLVVGVKENEQILEKFLNVLVNPRSIL